MYFKYLLISLLFFTNVCASNQFIPVVYHPYLSNKLCDLSIRGDLGIIHSVSIPLNYSNIFDIEGENIDLSYVLLDSDSEYYFPKIDPKVSSFEESIPCRKQLIRIRYNVNSELRILDLFFETKKKQSFNLKLSKSGELLDENK